MDAVEMASKEHRKLRASQVIQHKEEVTESNSRDETPASYE